MDIKTSAEEDLASIRKIMEKSSRFISLSGLSGIMAGLYALAGAVVAYLLLYYPDPPFGFRVPEESVQTPLLLTALIVAAATVLTGFWLSARKARQHGERFPDQAGRRFLWNVAIPLIAGGLFILILLARNHPGFAAPACLIFYGLALVNGGSFTLSEIRFLGMIEIGLGLLCAALPGLSLLFWTAGFGLLHILYGILMYNKYDR